MNGKLLIGAYFLCVLSTLQAMQEHTEEQDVMVTIQYMKQCAATRDVIQKANNGNINQSSDNVWIGHDLEPILIEVNKEEGPQLVKITKKSRCTIF